MRGWVLRGVLCVGLSGCSLLLSSEPDDGPPDDCPTAAIDRVTIFEGEGAVSDDWSAEPRMLGVTGNGLPSGGDLGFSGAPLELAGAVFNGSAGVVEVRFEIDPTRPVDPSGREVDEVDLTVFETGGACVKIPVRLVYLPELEVSSSSINGATLEPLYSVVRLEDVVGIGSQEIAVTATGAIELRGSLDFSGDDGGAGGPGPGGGAGGETAAGSRMGMFEGGGLPGIPAETDSGSGAGHAVAGDAGDNAGGSSAGHITLQRVALGDRRGGHGGGACTGEPGGHGGGVFIAKAGGVIASLEEGTVISASGGAGGNAACKGGDGSAGAVYLGAPQIVTVGSALAVDIDGTGSAVNRIGASGGRLRVDSDDAAFVDPGASLKISHWLGGGLVPPAARIVEGSDNLLNLEVFGGASLARDDIGAVEIVNRVGGAEMPLSPLGPPPATVTAELSPGLNRLCVINYRHADSSTPPIDEDLDLATNCISVGYVP